MASGVEALEPDRAREDHGIRKTRLRSFNKGPLHTQCQHRSHVLRVQFLPLLRPFKTCLTSYTNLPDKAFMVVINENC